MIMFNIEEELKKKKEKPGAYVMRNRNDNIIYVGKAVSLKEKIIEYTKINNINLKLNWGVFPERESESPCIYGDRTKLDMIIENYNKTKI